MPADGGIRFGQFLLLRRIARGGMAEVFLAQQRGLEGFDRRVAVKRILPHLADSPDFLKMFLGEAKLAAQLSHPNIVHIYDFGKVDHDYFIAMEYVEGVHTGQVFKHGEVAAAAPGRMSPTLVARIGADAAAALHYAHELVGAGGKALGLVHRDVSPANIMVSYDGIVKLCDFGIAKAMAVSDQLTNPGQVKGKYAYMSPEQTIAAPLDGRSDVFSLAIVLWELLTGKTIVPRGDAVEAMRAIRDGKLTPIDKAAPHVPPELAKAITWALETKRDRRATAAEFHGALEAFIKKSPELATPMQLAQWVRLHFPRDVSGQHPALGPPGPRTTAAPGTNAAPGTSVAAGTVAGTGHVGTVTPTSNLLSASVVSEPDETAETILLSSSHANATFDERPNELANRPTAPRNVPSAQIRAAEEPTKIDPNAMFMPAESGVTILPAPAAIPPTPVTRIHERLPNGGRAAPPLVTDKTMGVRPQPPRYLVPLLVMAGIAILSFALALAVRSCSAETTSEIDAATRVVEAPTIDAAVADAPPTPIDAASVDAAPAPAAYLVVNTTPKDATIKVGDQTRTSPAQFALAAGTYEVVAELEGYRAEKRTIVLERGEHRTYDIAFAKRVTPPDRQPPQPGRLSVRTTPYSDVFHGTRKLGQTPFEIQLPAGTYVLLFKNPAHPTTSRSVKVNPNKTTKVVFELRR